MSATDIPKFSLGGMSARGGRNGSGAERVRVKAIEWGEEVEGVRDSEAVRLGGVDEVDDDV